MREDDPRATRRWFFGAAALGAGCISSVATAQGRDGGQANAAADGVLTADMVRYRGRTVAAKLADGPSTDDYGLSAGGSADANTALLNGLIDETHAGAHALTVGEGRFKVTQVQIPFRPDGDYRGRPYCFLGRGTGEPYANSALQRGTVLSGVDASLATVRIRRTGPVQGSGSIEFGRLRLDGTQDAGVPVLEIEGLIGFNDVHDVSIQQDGAGDGVHLGWLGGSAVQNFVLLSPTWAASAGDLKSAGPRGAPSARTGTGLKWQPETDIGLGELRHGTARGFRLGYQFGGGPGGGKLLAHSARQLEVSTCTDGVLVTPHAEGLHIDQVYVEGCDGRAVVDRGRATLITAPYIVLEFTTGIEFRGIGGVSVGGVLGLAVTGSKGIVIGAESGGASVFGTQLVWGAGGTGRNIGQGVVIEPQANPSVALFVDYRGAWAGAAGSARLVDQSYSAEHGGAAAANGSGAIGWLERTSRAGEPLPCLSRGAVNLKVDGGWLSEADITRAGVLNLSEASVQRLKLAGPGVAIERFAAPNLPDKTGKILITGGFARINPSPYLKGISIPVILAAGEDAVIEYQNLPGPTGVCWITSVSRTGDYRYSVAELLRGNAGGPWPAQPFPVFAKDGRRRGETSGAGSGCAVFHDGSTWRTTYDNSIVTD